MSIKGLVKSTHYWNNIEARKDWLKLVEQVKAAGREDLLKGYDFDASVQTWRFLDKQFNKLKAEFEAAKS